MLYDIGFLIFSIIYLPALIFKGKLHRDFGERFGRFDKTKERALYSGKDHIWIQAVSVGEVALCKSLVPLLKKNFPEHDIVLSTITKTGNDLAKKLFSSYATIIYFPLDFSFTVKRALGFIKPKIYIMIETEIWPNLLKELFKKSIPAIMINGRISDRSIDKYRMARPFLKNILSRVNTFCMQDSVDADRIISMGAPHEKVMVTGNMKFDIDPFAGIKASDIVRKFLGLNEKDILLAAGSTHKGEEEVVAKAFKELATEFPRLRLLIAPRHIDRVSELESDIRRVGLEPIRVSMLNSSKQIDGHKKVLVLDTIGHLNEAYSVAELVFVGGSLIKHGGQNPIEPAIFGKAILFGPHMFNFKYITNALLKADGAMQVIDERSLVRSLRGLIENQSRRFALGENAKKVIDRNRGATEKNLEKIGEILKK